MPAHKVYRPCAQCGADFWAKGRRFCSRECYLESKRTGEERTCPICQGTYYVPAWDAERKTCSHECGIEWRSLHLVGEAANNWRGDTRVKVCRGCAQEYRACDYSRRRAYCSHTCYARHHSQRARAQRPRATCEQCGKVYGVRAGRQGRFCSNACRHLGMRGVNAPTFIHGRTVKYWGRNWKRQRRRALERDGHACTACGVTGRLEVHHLVPRALFGQVENANRLSNLVTLCKSCHIEAEKDSRKLYRTGQLWLVA